MLPTISKTTDLEERLSQPSDQVIGALSRIEGDLLILGAGGKMGPSLARMAHRCFDSLGMDRKVFSVSRFSDTQVRDGLDDFGVKTLSGDLFDANFIASLPNCKNIVFMAGMKFGSSGNESTTWATNAYLPGAICQRFATSTIACLSTGNVYGLVSVDGQSASQETDALRPAGEYAQSCVGRERVVEYFSRTLEIPVSMIRLNYATELRYGILVDLARQVFSGTPISLEMGYFNVIWQTDACDLTLRSLEHASSPPALFNLTGSEIVSCREVCEKLAAAMGKQVRFVGKESESALLSDSSKTRELIGKPRVTLDEMIACTAAWISSGGQTWNKPTHFEVRDGKY